MLLFAVRTGVWARVLWSRSDRDLAGRHPVTRWSPPRRAVTTGIRRGNRCPEPPPPEEYERTCMQKTDAVEVEGRVTEALPNGMFRVELTNGHKVLAHLSGRMRRNYIRVMLEDRVVVELSTYDLTRGRLVYRHK